MDSTVERTSSYLREALDRDLELYELYVSSPKVLAGYLELTKQALLTVVEDVIRQIGYGTGASRQSLPFLSCSSAAL